MQKISSDQYKLISLVICTMNRPNDIINCLRSINKQIHLPYEVIIVDASQDYSTENICFCWQKLNLFKMKYVRTSPGLTKQRNIGISKATCGIIGFIDDDVVFDKNYLYEVASCFEKNKNVFGITGNIINFPKKNNWEKIYSKIFMFMNTSNTGDITKAGFPNFLNKHITDKNQYTRILSGCNMFYRKQIFDVYLFDEYFEGYSLLEDVEFSYRISKKYKLMYNSAAKLVHNHSPSQRVNLNRFFEMMVLNHDYVFKKLVKTSDIDLLCHWWGNVGILSKSLYWAIKDKSVSPFVGCLKALIHS